MRISVIGTHSVKTAPELGVLSLNISAEDRDRRAAFDAARSAAEAVVAAVEREKTEDADGVSRLSVSPVSVSSYRPQSESGQLLPEVHNATAQVTVAFRDVERLSRFAGEAGSAPHIRLNHIAWELTEETALRVRDEQTAAAVAEAMRRAQVVATAAGAGAVTVVEVADPGLLSEEAPPHPTAMMARAGAAEDGLDPEFLQVVPRPVRTAVTVHVRCEA